MNGILIKCRLWLTSESQNFQDDIIYTEDDDKATLMNNFFLAQTVLDETQATIPPDIPIPGHSLDFFTSTFEV